MKLIFLVIAAAAGLLSLVCVGLFGYGWWFEKPALRYENLPFPVVLQQVRPGEIIPIRVRRCNDSNQEITYTVVHALHAVDSDVRYVMLPRLTTMGPNICETVTSMINDVPLDARPLRYKIVGAGIIQGSLRSFIVPWYSAPFEVVAK